MTRADAMREEDRSIAVRRAGEIDDFPMVDHGWEDAWLEALAARRTDDKPRRWPGDGNVASGIDWAIAISGRIPDVLIVELLDSAAERLHGS